MSWTDASRPPWLRIMAAIALAPFLPGLLICTLGAWLRIVRLRPDSPTELGQFGETLLSLPFSDPLVAFGPGLALAALHAFARARPGFVILAGAAIGVLGLLVTRDGALLPGGSSAALWRNALFAAAVGALAWWMSFRPPAETHHSLANGRMLLAGVIVPFVPGLMLWLMTQGKTQSFTTMTFGFLFVTIPSAMVALVMAHVLRAFYWRGALAFPVAGFITGASAILLINGRRPIDPTARDFIFLGASLGALAMTVGWAIAAAGGPLTEESDARANDPAIRTEL